VLWFFRQWFVKPKPNFNLALYLNFSQQKFHIIINIYIKNVTVQTIEFIAKFIKKNIKELKNLHAATFSTAKNWQNSHRWKI
jgi:hypothetical protein